MKREGFRRTILLQRCYRAPRLLLSMFVVSALGAARVLAAGLLEPATNPPTAAAPVSSTAEPHFEIRAYEIRGDTLLSVKMLTGLLTKYTGTNKTLMDIKKAASELQTAYLNRGYVTVKVTVPPQSITNGIVKFRVFQGRLAEVIIDHNRHFSSNNVMRALPGLRTNMILNSVLFQAELDRANANRDRQIYPEIRPGPETNTSSLYLEIKDRLPLHGRVELNNQSTPGTPELRVNTSLVYNNLWQLEHAMGVQYGFSPESYKTGNQWNFYDQPLIANYSAFYRLPLANPDSITELVRARPGQFGYDEATRQFHLPPPSGLPELNVYASRSTIDTGLEKGSLMRLFDSERRTIDEQDTHQDLTVNESIGFRLSKPLPQLGTIRSGLSAGLDFKTYKSSSFATNSFIFTEVLLDENGNPLPPRVSQTDHPIPSSSKSLYYLPFTFRWDGGRPDKHGTTGFGLGYTPNLWFSGSQSNLQSISGSTRSSGYWHAVSANISREQNLYKDWKLTLRADGQWASEPLISNEQFGVGGLAGVRGYREGEVFGDAGWRISGEVRSGLIAAGQAFDKYPMYVRYAFFMDYGETYLLDAQGRSGRTPLWGVGAGATLAFGTHFDGRVAVAWPLLNTPHIWAGETRFYFGINAQF